MNLADGGVGFDGLWVWIGWQMHKWQFSKPMENQESHVHKEAREVGTGTETGTGEIQ